jgi:hypothetical protein
MSLIFRLLKRFFHPPAPQPVPRLVADIPFNRDNSFWKPYIGSAVLILATDPDGLVTVVVYDQPGIPIPGIDPKRFT